MAARLTVGLPVSKAILDTELTIVLSMGVTVSTLVS